MTDFDKAKCEGITVEVGLWDALVLQSFFQRPDIDVLLYGTGGNSHLEVREALTRMRMKIAMAMGKAYRDAEGATE